MEEIAEETALYFDPYDPMDIAATIKKIFSDGFDRNHFLQNRKKILQRYSWENAAHAMLSVFESEIKK
jgi:glycosyltransferase involved in cell wall biosynthesis